MFNKRIIPTLLISENKLIKTEKFKSPVYVGDPINVAKIFNDKEVDELAIIDIDATRRGQQPNFELIKTIASECFMPVSYGGGISSFEDAERILKSGVEKIIVQSIALENPTLINRITEVFGVQSLIVSLDVVPTKDNKTYTLFSRANMFRRFFKSRYLLANKIDELNKIGIGEYLITNVNKEGTLNGLDYDLIKATSDLTECPIIYAGGASDFEDISKAFKFGAHAVSVGRLFTLHGSHKAVLVSYPKRSEIKKILNEAM